MLGSGVVSKKKRPKTFGGAVRDQWIRLGDWLKATAKELRART